MIKTICVDFDGVIHSYKSGWKGAGVIPDPPVEGAIEWLKDNMPLPEKFGLWDEHYYRQQSLPWVVIYSSRSKSWRGRRAMKKWLIKWGLPREYIDDGILQFPKEKPAAWLTIDDRAFCFEGRFPSRDEMANFKPWYKRGD